MAVGSLTSNHVNYLVWRYLQEAGFGDSAVRLQRDWRADPQDLPFAPFISGHALVSLVQKGLHYHEIECALDQDGNPISTPPEAASFFGPGVREQPPPSPKRDHEQPGPAPSSLGVEHGSASPRKHPRPPESATMGGATAFKRSRRSNGTTAEQGDAMEIDSSPHPEPNGTNGYAHDAPDVDVKSERIRPDAPAQEESVAAPEDQTTTTTAPSAMPRSTSSRSSPAVTAITIPTAPEPAAVATPPPPLPPPRLSTHGSSVGTQVDKIAELGAEAETTFLDLGGRNVLHCAWSPSHPSSLLTAGTEALARIWDVARQRRLSSSEQPPADGSAATPAAAANANGPTYLSLKQSNNSSEKDDERWMVTAVAWSHDGEFVAIALCDAAAVYDGNVFIWSRSGKLANVFPIGQYPVLCLRWSVSGTILLGLCANMVGTSIMLWDPMTADALDSIGVDEPLEDAAWVHPSGFIVVGGNALQVYRFDGRIAMIHAYQPSDHDDLWLVRHDPVTGLVATCTHTASISIYDQRELLHSFTAHAEPITALEWQPLQNPRALSDTEPRLLASSSIDGTIRVWDGRHPGHCIHKLILGRANFPVMALSFSPDGFALAAASSHGQILVWNAREGGSPLAAWSGANANAKANANGEIEKFEEDDPMTNGDGDGDENGGLSRDAEQHSLSWDADGGKLAYAAGREVAIIDFRR